MPDGEVELIMRSMHACVRTYDQIVEVSILSLSAGGGDTN